MLCKISQRNQIYAKGQDSLLGIMRWQSNKDINYQESPEYRYRNSVVDELKEKLLKASVDGNIFELIQEVYYEDRRGENILPTLLVELHNEGRLNIVELFASLKNDTEVNDFFSVWHVFEEVLPDINSPVKDVSDCLKHLTLKAGQDMNAFMLMSPFKEFCKKDIDRARGLLEIALKNIDECVDYLSIAIEAGASNDEVQFVNKAMDLLNHESELIIQRAILALGRIDYQEKMLLKPVVMAIKESSSCLPTDVILSESMVALFGISSKAEGLEDLFLDFLNANSDHFGDRYIDAASRILFLGGENISSNVESKLLDVCSHANPENTRTIKNIDYALVRILKRNRFDDCVVFLERFFELSGYRLSVSYFDSFVRELNNCRNSHLPILLTRWFLSGNSKLGKYASDLLGDSDKGISIGFDGTLVAKERKGVHLYLARKACGWFFNQPKTAISLIESLIINAPDDELEGIKMIIFNPLCVSYPGSVCDHLEIMRSSQEERVKKVAMDVLSEYKGYQSSVKSALKVKELRPGEKDRHAYYRHRNKLMSESMEAARSKSLLTSLFGVSESILLYGNKSIHYMHNGDEKIRQELPLSEISRSFEFASMHNLDPHGLEYMIFNFKIEGFTS